MRPAGRKTKDKQGHRANPALPYFNARQEGRVTIASTTRARSELVAFAERPEVIWAGLWHDCCVLTIEHKGWASMDWGQCRAEGFSKYVTHGTVGNGETLRKITRGTVCYSPGLISLPPSRRDHRKDSAKDN